MENGLPGSSSQWSGLQETHTSTPGASGSQAGDSSHPGTPGNGWRRDSVPRMRVPEATVPMSRDYWAQNSNSTKAEERRLAGIMIAASEVSKETRMLRNGWVSLMRRWLMKGTMGDGDKGILKHGRVKKKNKNTLQSPGTGRWCHRPEPALSSLQVHASHPCHHAGRKNLTHDYTEISQKKKKLSSSLADKGEQRH